MALQILKDAAEKAKKNQSGITTTEISILFISMGAAGSLHLTQALIRSILDDLTRDLE